MTPNQTFKTSATFRSFEHDENAGSWHFNFDCNISVSACGFWRLLKANKVWVVSLDQGHRFGLPEPLDIVKEITKQLVGKTLTELRIKNTGDLELHISDEIVLEFYISSSGYETYEFLIHNKRYIGLGSGEIKVFDNLME